MGPVFQAISTGPRARGFWALRNPDKAGLGHASLALGKALLSRPEKGGPVPQGSGAVLALRRGLPGSTAGVGVEVGLEQ